MELGLLAFIKGASTYKWSFFLLNISGNIIQEASTQLSTTLMIDCHNKKVVITLKNYGLLDLLKC